MNACHKVSVAEAALAGTITPTRLQSLCSKATGETWVINPASGARTADADALDLSPFSENLDIKAGDYAGAYLKDTDYSYVAFNVGYKSDSYGYVILAAGSGDRKSPPIGTGYGVMEIRNAGWTEKQLSTFVFERYKVLDGRTAGNTLPLWLSDTGFTTKSGDYVEVPFDWASDMPAPTVSGGPDGDAFKAAGWTMQ